MAEQVGKVYLVGSGPGDAAYLTLQAQEVLAQAEVLIYDALVDGDLIDWVPDTCLKLDVGKRGGKPSTPQSEINRLLVKHCQQGQQVVRLKNGDPFIFGRAQSEIGALKQANCDFEIIPGLSSALVAPLMAGIPLTDPQLSRSFTVVTAHDPDALNWVSLAKLDTLIFLMGGRTLPEIVRRLRGHGRSPVTPVAIIRYAGRREQQIWDGTLNTILDQTAGEPLSPCVIVVGEVVKLRAYVGEQGRRPKPDTRPQPTDNRTPEPEILLPPPAPLSPPATANRPLANQTILVTRAASQSRQFTELLAAEGASVIEMPTLEIGPPSSWRDLDRAIDRIDDFDWLIFTSTNAVDSFFERLEVVTGERAFYSNIKIAVVGEKTAQRLLRLGIQPDFVPPNFIADSLVSHFPEPLGGLRVLFPRVESGGREVLVKEFTSMGAKVREVAAYESRCPEAIAPQALRALQTGRVDIVTFASSKTVRHFCQLLQQVQDDWQDWLTGVAIAAIGPQTSEACQSLLGRVDVEAAEYTLNGLTQALVQFALAPVPQPNPETPPSNRPLSAGAVDPVPPPASKPLAPAEQPISVPVPGLPEDHPLPPYSTEADAVHALTDPAPASSASLGDLGAELGAIANPTSTEQILARLAAHSPSPPGEEKPEQPTGNDQLEAANSTTDEAVIEVELVPESEASGDMETVQVELDSASSRPTVEADFVAEIQAVIQEVNAEPSDRA